MPPPFRRRSWLLTHLSVLLAGSFGLQAHALERITLRNGFFYDCVRHEPVDSTHVRLFLGGNDTSGYIDLPAGDIVSADPLPAPASAPATRAASDHAAPVTGADIPALLLTAGTHHNIDVALLASIVHAESSGHGHAVSRTGARGLMQLMPTTARGLGIADSFEPGQNINGGTAYLDFLLTRYHDNLALALAAYNAGPGAVDRYHGIPPFHETCAYVARVMTEFKRRKEALAHQPAPTLQASR